MIRVMPRALRVEAVSVSRGGNTHSNRWRVAGGFVKYAALSIAACLIWNYIGAGDGKPKFHGALLTPLAGLLTLQEFLFFNARGKLGDALRSPAIHLRELESTHAQVRRLKAYADRLWLFALPSKMIAVILGATLLLGGNAVIVFTVKGHPVSGDALMGIFGWFAVLLGLDLTWRTFRIFKHVDARLAELEVDARKLSASKEAAKEFKDAAALTPHPTADDSYTRSKAVRTRSVGGEKNKS